MFFKVDSVAMVKKLEKYFINNFPLKNKIFIVYYYKDGCGACSMFKPIWESAVGRSGPNVIAVEIEEKYMGNLFAPNTIIGFPTVHVQKFGRSRRVIKDNIYVGALTPKKLNNLLGAKKTKKTKKKRINNKRTRKNN